MTTEQAAETLVELGSKPFQWAHVTMYPCPRPGCNIHFEDPIFMLRHYREHATNDDAAAGLIDPELIENLPIEEEHGTTDNHANAS